MRQSQTPSPDEQVLARATKQSIQSAGGLDICARETGISTSQLSRCSSPHDRDSLTIRDAHSIEAIGHGASGHPHILRALARLLGYVIVKMPDAPDDPDGLMQSVMTLTCELGDVAQAISSALADNQVSEREAQFALLQLDDLDMASAALRLQLDVLTKKGKRPKP